MKYRVTVEYEGHPKDIRRAVKKLIHNIGEKLCLDAKQETDNELGATLDYGIIEEAE